MGHGHDHGVSATTDRRRLGIALTLLLGFAIAEVVTGLLAGSVALLADAGHMSADPPALTLARVAIGLAARPPGGAMTFGLKRAEPASALVNGVTLAVLAVVFAVSAVQRLITPNDLAPGPMPVPAPPGPPRHGPPPGGPRGPRPAQRHRRR